MNRKKTFTVFVSILAFVVICATFCIFYVQRMLFSPNFTVSEGGNEYIFVYPDYKIDDLASQMEQKQMVTDTKKIYLSARLLKMSDKRLTPGCYRVSDDMSSWQLMSKIRRGEQTPRKLVLNNIRLPEQFAQKVGSQLMVDSATVYRYVTDTAKMASLGFTPEQLFVMVVADTYEMWWTAPIDAIMKRLKSEHNKFWARDNRDELAKQLGMSRAEVVTLASIVDEETNRPSERRRIAGLYVNRLNCGMMLQSDPTVKYATGNFTLNQILYSHLNIDSPYNTYKNYGLPPGPIRLPHTATIDAVLNAEQHNYLYMCATEQLDGTHKFARTLSEHNANALRYHKALREWKKQQK